MGFVGKIVSFAFFLMVVIAAITSVMSLIEVATQFVIQKFRPAGKVSALIVAGVCFLVSIPIGISLGHVAILEESGPAPLRTGLADLLRRSHQHRSHARLRLLLLRGGGLAHQAQAGHPGDGGRGLPNGPLAGEDPMPS